MKISREQLIKETELTGFRSEILEKVIYLMDLLQDLAGHKLLSKKIALKGGTALNLFCFDYPRLSVDIDLNYIGAEDRETMVAERKSIMDAIEDICLRKSYRIQVKPEEHAGGKWILRFPSALQGNPRLEIDLNFLTRVPLWPVTLQDSYQLGSYSVQGIPVLDKHELAGGKLKALFSRHSSRDLFDANYILTSQQFDYEKLRIAFLVYGGMSRVDWRTIKVDDISFEWLEFKNMLLPMFKKTDIQKISKAEFWANEILAGCRSAISYLLPLRRSEIEFMNCLLDYGEIKPELLTNDQELIRKIVIQPGLKWKAVHVKKHKLSYVLEN